MKSRKFDEHFNNIKNHASNPYNVQKSRVTENLLKPD